MIPVKFINTAITLLLFMVALTVEAEQVTHTYDAQNRLIRTEYSDGNAIEYTYDAAGNRIGQKAINTASANSYPLTVTKSPSGVVSSSPEGILCGGPNKQCKGTFSAVVLTATPNPGYYLKKWVGCPSPTENTCNLTLTRKATVKAVFAKLPKVKLKLTKTPLGGGIHIEPGGLTCKDTKKTCSLKFYQGTPITLEAHAAPGRSFLYWGGACTGTVPTCSLTMDTNKEVSATFQ